MIKDGKGGANTVTGLIYEGEVDLATFLSKQKDYTVKGTKVYYKGNEVAQTFKKNQFYKFLEERGVD